MKEDGTSLDKQTKKASKQTKHHFPLMVNKNPTEFSTLKKKSIGKQTSLKIPLSSFSIGQLLLGMRAAALKCGLYTP